LDPDFTALVFSDANIRLLALDRANFHTENFLEISLAEGAIVSGVIKKEGEIVKVLEGLKEKVKSPFVKFAVPDEISYVFTASVSVSAGQTAEEPVSFILEENVPLLLSDISFDFTPLNIEKSENGFKSKMLVTAVSSSIIESYTKVLKEAGFVPIYCVNESQAIARSIVPSTANENAAIVYVHRNIVGIYITEGQIVEFSSTIQIPPNSSPKLFTSFVTAELKKSLDYWREKAGKDKARIINCYLCGKYEECKLVIEDAGKLGEVAVRFGNVWQNTFSLADYIPEISFEDSLRFAGAVGLFL